MQGSILFKHSDLMSDGNVLQQEFHFGKSSYILLWKIHILWYMCFSFNVTVLLRELNTIKLLRVAVQNALTKILCKYNLRYFSERHLCCIVSKSMSKMDMLTFCVFFSSSIFFCHLNVKEHQILLVCLFKTTFFTF